VGAVDRVLRRHDIRYVVVGGQAVARSAATATVDVDVMVTTADYRDAIARLEQDPELTKAWDGGAVCRFGLRSRPGIPLDVVDAGAFAGLRPGAEFFSFLEGEESTEVEGIRYASPAAVWYTRLMTKRWRAYAEKIVTNVVDGLGVAVLARVEAIGRRFGTESALRPRLQYVQEELDARSLGPSERDAESSHVGRR